MSNGSLRGCELRWIIVAVLANWCWWSDWGSFSHAIAAAPAAAPNIVFLLIDDMNVDQVGCFGGTATLTPNLDRMAAEGIQFLNAHVTTTVCTPSRYSFMTGRYAGRSYSKKYTSLFTGNKQGYPDFNMALEADKTNIAATLHQAGYRTGMVGKCHLFSELDKPEFYTPDTRPKSTGTKQNPLLPGPQADAVFQFNEQWGRRYLQSLGFDFAKHIYLGNLENPYSVHNPEWTLLAALEFLDQQKSVPNQPFYLQYCPTLTHGGGQQFVSALKSLDITGAGRQTPAPVMQQWRDQFKRWLKSNEITDPDAIGITWVDFQVGCILDRLQQLGFDQNTLVIFSPDHGRDSKSALYSFNGTQVPLLMRWPAGIQPGQKNTDFVQNIDIAPTLYELVGAAVPETYSIDGRSLCPFLTGQRPETWRDDIYSEIGVARAVQTKHWKYIALRHTTAHLADIKRCRFDRLPAALAPTKKLGIGVRAITHPGFYDEEQLYNLDADPKEMNNLAYEPQLANQLQEMKARLAKHLRRVGTPYGEFLPGADTAPPGQVDTAIALAQQLKVKNRNVIVPPELMQKYPEQAGKPEPRPRDRKRQQNKLDDESS